MTGAFFQVMAIAYIWLTVRILGSETVEAVAFKAQNNCMAVLWIFLTIAVLSELHALCALFVLASGNSSMSWVAKMNARLFNGIFCALYISVLLSLAIAFGFAEVSDIVIFCLDL